MKVRCRLIKQTGAFTMYNNLEVRRLGMRKRVKTRNDSGLHIWIFSQKLPFSVGKNVSKTNLGSTIHYIYTSYIN